MMQALLAVACYSYLGAGPFGTTLESCHYLPAGPQLTVVWYKGQNVWMPA